MYQPGSPDIPIFPNVVAGTAGAIPAPAADVVLQSGARFISTDTVECMAPEVGSLADAFGAVSVVSIQVSTNCSLDASNLCSNATWSDGNVSFIYTNTAPLYSTAEGENLGPAVGGDPNGWPKTVGQELSFIVKAFQDPTSLPGN